MMARKIGILGAGTWGTALARMLAVNGSDVLLWSAIPAEIDSLAQTHVHPNLPGMVLPDSLRFTKDLAEACKRPGHPGVCGAVGVRPVHGGRRAPPISATAS